MTIVSTVSLWFIPLIIAAVLLHGTWKKIPVYEVFAEGGKEGIKIAVSIIPFLVGMLVSIYIMRSSGALEFLINLIAPLLHAIGVPAEVIPLALVRPISGTAALGMTSELIAVHGPDSLIGRMVSTMQGSTDTTLYILTVYFGAVGIKKMGDALKVGLLADLVGLIAAITVVLLVFG